MNTLDATFSAQPTSNLLRMMSSTKSRSSSKLGHVGSKSRSQDQIKEKYYEHSRGHIFSLINFKLAHNNVFDEILVKFETGLCGIKSRTPNQIIEKLCEHSRDHIFSPNNFKLAQNDVLDKISDKFEIGSCGVKKIDH